MKRRRGRAHGAAMMVWLFFANLFEPSKLPSTEAVADARRRGSESQRLAAIGAGKRDG